MRTILLIEDNPGDIYLAEEGLSMNDDDPPRIAVKRTAKGALDWLKDHTPDLVLLDLNMPDMTGHEVLLAIRRLPQSCQVPIVVLSNSSDQRDVKMAYQHGANSYLRKPVEFTEFVQMLTALKHYWFEISVLPKTE